jgi:hypothetical protein
MPGKLEAVKFPWEQEAGGWQVGSLLTVTHLVHAGFVVSSVVDSTTYNLYLRQGARLATLLNL